MDVAPPDGDPPDLQNESLYMNSGGYLVLWLHEKNYNVERAGKLLESLQWRNQSMIADNEDNSGFKKKVSVQCGRDGQRGAPGISRARGFMATTPSFSDWDGGETLSIRG